MSESNQCGVESSVVGRDTSETEALEVIADVTKSLQLAKTFFSSQPDWYLEIIHFEQVSLTSFILRA